MAISFRAAAAGAFSAASFSVPIDAAQVTGDMMFLVAMGKPYNSAWSVTVASGWTSLGRGESGTTAAGVDTGSMVVEVWYKEALSDTETAPTITEGSPAWNVVGARVFVYQKGAGESWDTPVVVFGADETSGTGISVTFGSDPGVTANDWIMLGCGINTDAMGPLTADLTPTQTGITFGTLVNRSESESATGGDMTLHVNDIPVNSGTGSAAPAATGTGTASGGADRLEAFFLRMRVFTTPAGTGFPFQRPFPYHIYNR